MIRFVKSTADTPSDAIEIINTPRLGRCGRHRSQRKRVKHSYPGWESRARAKQRYGEIDDKEGNTRGCALSFERDEPLAEGVLLLIASLA